MKQTIKNKVYKYNKRRITLDENILNKLELLKDTTKLNIFIESILNEYIEKNK